VVIFYDSSYGDAMSIMSKENKWSLDQSVWLPSLSQC
jgi:hypothetical protein